MTREEEIQKAAKNRADQYEHPVDWNNCYHHYIQGAKWADQHPREGLWESEKVMLFLIDAFKELPNGNGTFKLKKECSMEQLLEDLRKAMEE